MNAYRADGSFSVFITGSNSYLLSGELMTNLTGIADYLRNTQGLAIKRETLASYIDLLVAAKVLYRCPRFDARSRRSLRGGEKYYLADAGIYFARNVDTTPNYGPLLENVTYTYLRSRGYGVSARIGPLSSRIQCFCATFASAARAPRYARCLPRNSSITSQGMTSTSS